MKTERMTMMRIIDLDFRMAIQEIRLYPFKKIEWKTKREEFRKKGRSQTESKAFAESAVVRTVHALGFD